MSVSIWGSLWLAMPVICGGLVHVLVIKVDGLRPLARVPLDGGLRLRGRRVLGENKTLRGALVMILATMAFAWLQAWIDGHHPAAAALNLAPFSSAHPLAWGALLGGGYIAGELPNSFVKRQLDIAPGEPGRGRWRPALWIVDQIDSLVGALAFMCVAWTPPWEAAAWLMAITLVVHPSIAGLMVALGLKSRVG